MRRLISQSRENQPRFKILHRSMKKVQRFLLNKMWKIKKEKNLRIPTATTSKQINAKFDMTVSSDRGRIPRRYSNEFFLIKDLVHNLKKDDVFYDIGANTGIYSSFALRKLAEGSVIAFEPYPPNIIQLEKNLEKNGENYQIIGVPLSDGSGTVDFTSPETGTAGKGTASMNDENRKFKTFAVAGDDLVERGKIPSPNIVKIDVEGSEPLVLDGMKKTLSRPSCRRLYIEIHLDNGERGDRCVEKYGETGEKILDKISNYGFEIQTIEENDDYRWHIIADKSATGT